MTFKSGDKVMAKIDSGAVVPCEYMAYDSKKKLHAVKFKVYHTDFLKIYWTKEVRHEGSRNSDPEPC